MRGDIILLILFALGVQSGLVLGEEEGESGLGWILLEVI